MKTKRCIGNCVRKVVERNAARGDRRGAAASRRAQSQQQHASPPPQHARSSTLHLSALLVNILRRRGFAKDAPLSAASPRGRTSHTFHSEKGPFGWGASEKSERATNGDPKVPENSSEHTASELIAGVRAIRGI